MKSRNTKKIRGPFVFSCLLGVVAVFVSMLVFPTAGARSSRREPDRSAGRVETTNQKQNVSITNGAGSSQILLTNAGESTIDPKTNARPPLAPLADNICFAGQTLGGGDPIYDRPSSAFTMSTGCNNDASGIVPAATGDDSPYDVYYFHVTGCTTPIVTAQTCTSSCGTQTSLDSVVFIYQKDNGDPSTAGDPIFDPSNPMDSNKLRAANNNACGLSATVTATVCPGLFAVIVAGNSATETGTYNLLVNVTGGGTCNLVNPPTAADGEIGGNISSVDGTPLIGATVNLSGTQNRKFITDANGNYRFQSVETNGFYTVTPSFLNYSFSPGNRSFSQLANMTEAAFTARPSISGVNAIDTADYYVRQHYVDFLGREPDEAGFNFWSDQILSCGNDQGCIERRRINVSAAYFLSVEFQRTGGLVDGLYRASYGRAPRYAEFIPDTQSVAHNVIVGRAGWPEQLETNQRNFLNAFVQRTAFRDEYDGLSNEGYVDRLISHTGVSFTNLERDALVSGLTTGTLTRADVLRQIAENATFVNAKRNEMFVMMEYFGYLRRDPDAGGYRFWLDKLNQFEGNFERAEMVKAFIVSSEYRARFSR